MKAYIGSHKKIVLVLSFLILVSLSVSAQVRPISVIDTESEYDIIYADFSPDGERLIVGGGATELWDVQTGKRLLNLEHPTGEGFMKGVSVSVKFSSDGKYVVVGYPASAYGWGDTILWNATSGAIVQTFRINKGMYVYNFPLDYETKGIGFNPEGDKLYTVTYSGTLREWDIKTGKELKNLKTRGYSSFSIFADGKRCVADEGVYSLEDGSELLLVEGRLFLNNNSQLFHLTAIINAQDQYQVLQLDTNTYKPKYTYSVFNSDSGNLSLSNTGMYILKGNNLLNKVGNKLLSLSTKIADTDQETSIKNVVFSPDDRTLAVLSGSKVYIYDVSDLTSSVKEAEALGR